MSTLLNILYVLATLGMVFMLVRVVRANPQWLTRESLSKSFGTMGFLALLLIVFVGMCVMLLRH